MTALAFSDDMRQCLTAAGDRSLRIHDVASGRVLRQIRDLDAPVLAAAFAPAGSLTVLTRKGTAGRYQQDSGELVFNQSHSSTHVTAAQLDSAGRRVVIADGNRVQLIELASGQIVQNLAQPDQVLAVALSADGQQVAAGAADQRIRIYHAESSDPLRTLEAPGGALVALRFSPDQRRLLSGGADQPVRLWDLVSGHLTELPSNSSHKQVALGFSPDGERAIVASTHGMVILWELASAQPVLFLRTRHPLLRTAALSADGRLVLVGGYDGSTRLYTIDPGRLWKRGCQTLAATTRPEDETRENWEQARAACSSTPAP